MLWMWGVVIFGLVSAIGYFRKFWRLVDDKIKLRRRKELLHIERRQKKLTRAQIRAEKAEAQRAEAQKVEQAR